MSDAPATLGLGERLRRLQANGRPLPALESAPVQPTPMAGDPQPIETLIRGQIIEAAGSQFFLAESRYHADSQHAGRSLHALLSVPAQGAARAGKLADSSPFDFARAAFIDIETSGLSGTGVYAFLVAVGTFETQEFVVRQYFMRNPAEERALIHTLAEHLKPCTHVVTFNGKSFDIPILHGRFVLQRQRLHLNEAPHLDLLPPARRLYKGRLGSCRLAHLEQEVLGLKRTGADVPGWLIPTLYYDYLRNGDARPIARVFYHNLEDVLSMTALAQRVCESFGGSTHEMHPQDLAGLARAHEAAGRYKEAVQAYQQALATAMPAKMRCEVMAQLAALLKRHGNHEAAAESWEQLAAEDAGNPQPCIELAMYYEWRMCNLPLAAVWTDAALTRAAGLRSRFERTELTEALTQRRKRLMSKIRPKRA